MRDSFIFYRSFYEAIKDLPRDVQGEIYTAIMEYGLYGKETENLKPIARSIFTLMRPQIEANNKRFENGMKGAEFGKLGGRPKKETPKKPQRNPKETPNVNDNVNDNDNVSDKSDINKTSTNVDSKENHDSEKTPYDKFCGWVKTNAPNVLKLQRQITETQFLKLKEKYDYKQIISILQSMDNHKELTKKYTSVYLTFLNWAKKAYGD